VGCEQLLRQSICEVQCHFEIRLNAITNTSTDNKLGGKNIEIFPVAKRYVAKTYGKEKVKIEAFLISTSYECHWPYN
jgi:hypothetical protein